MVKNTVILFLFGATIASGRFVQNLKSVPSEFAVMPSLQSPGCPPAQEFAPLICKFMQNMEIPYKPQLITPSTYIPPMAVQECDTPQLQMEIEIPLPVEEKRPFIIPQPPALPPIKIPKFPVPVMVEKPYPPPVPFIEPCEPTFISEMPVNIPEAPILPPQVLPAFPQIVKQPEPIQVIEPEFAYKPMVIPQPPKLPALVMPELPVRFEPPMIVAPCPEDKPIDVVPIPEKILPAYPAPTRLPEILFHIEPSQPILPPPMVFERPAEPCITGEPVIVPRPQQQLEFIMPEPVKVGVKKPVPKPMVPVYAEPTYIADPCEPTVNMNDLMPYLARQRGAYNLVKDYVVAKSMERVKLPTQRFMSRL